MPATGRHTERCRNCGQMFTYPANESHTNDQCRKIQELRAAEDKGVSKEEPTTIVRVVHDPIGIENWDDTMANCKHWEVHLHYEGGGDLDFYECQYCQKMWDSDEWAATAESRKLWGEPTKRHPGVEHLLSLFEYMHLPEHLQSVSQPCHDLANLMVDELGDGIELTAALRHLLYAKDSFVRQAVIDHRKEQ